MTWSKFQTCRSAEGRSIATLLPIMTVVYIAYLVIELLMNRLTVEADFWRKELHRFGVFSIRGVHLQVILPLIASAEGFRRPIEPCLR